MYRILWFQLIFENIYRILLLISIIQCCFSQILFCSYKSDFLRFNDMIIRETISSKNIDSYFAVNINNYDIQIKTDYTSDCSILDEYPLTNTQRVLIDNQRLFTNYKFKDTVIKNSTITLYDYNYTSNFEHLFNIIGIFKSSPLNKESKSLTINFIYDNNIILSNQLTVNNNVISFYKQFISTPGYHSFQIEVHSQDTWCLCPNKGNGFENNKYIFAWTDINPLLNNKEYTYLTKITDNKYSVVV
jgi:hypothetical protein